jgi:hypothetical protein
MKKTYFGLFLVMMELIFIGCSSQVTNSDTTPTVKPDAASVKTAYNAVNDDVNYLCSADVTSAISAILETTYSYNSGTLTVKVTPTSVTYYPCTVVYTMTNFVGDGNDGYTVSGTQTAIITADGWTAKGSMTGTLGDIKTLTSDMVKSSGIVKGTLVVNGYAYDFATGAYK